MLHKDESPNVTLDIIFLQKEIYFTKAAPTGQVYMLSFEFTSGGQYYNLMAGADKVMQTDRDLVNNCTALVVLLIIPQCLKLSE